MIIFIFFILMILSPIEVKAENEFVQAIDGGNICYDSSECKGICIYEYDETDDIAYERFLILVTENRTTSGFCSDNANIKGSGCYNEVKNGHIKRNVCY